jgi:alcohol dehydrogenase class IV
VSDDFIWRDAGRVVVFRRDGIGHAPQLLSEHGFEAFELLSTERALAGAPALADAATLVHEVALGSVPDLAASLLGAVGSSHLVALGGGRVIDTTKALAAVTGAAVAAIPLTLSGAEMTGIHRLPAGAEDRAGSMVRPRLAIADPEAMTSQPEAQLRASAMNSLAHGADSLHTPFANPASRALALLGAKSIAEALDEAPVKRDRSALAQGSILCGYAIDSAMFGVHHVVCQTLVRVCGTPHAETNAAILPRALAFMASRVPDNLAPLASAIGAEPAKLEDRVLELGGHPAGLAEVGGDRDKLDEALDAMLARPELAFTPEPPTRDDLRRLIEAAW